MRYAARTDLSEDGPKGLPLPQSMPSDIIEDDMLAMPVTTDVAVRL